MCGIVGAYGAKMNLDNALHRLEHRGPDGYDTAYQYESSLGHTRLAIVDVHGGDQPLHSADGNKLLVCNGEIYNHAALRKVNADYDYSTRSDNEIILALYERYGTDAIHQLNGMFAFALLDEDKLILARDPLGIKPLYYAWHDDTLYFGSEIKALQGLVDEIHEFPPGHYYSTDEGFVKFYDVIAAAGDRPQEPATPEAIRDALTKAVQRRLMSDVPLGVFLSGGLDSSIITGLVAQALPNVHSFAVGVEGSVDLAHARQVAEYVGTQHHEYVYTVDEMIEALPEIIYYLESFDPSLVRSAIPNYFLTRLARQYVTVVLTGEGADELYAGYHYFKDFDDADAIHAEMAHLTDTLYSCNLLRCDRMSMAHSLEARVPFLDTEFIKLSFNVPVEQKLHGEEKVEKWVLRKAFEGLIPDEVLWRVKEQFSKGAGSAHVFDELAEREISDTDFDAECAEIQRETGLALNSKEELYYFRIFRRFFGIPAMGLVKRWRGSDAGTLVA